MQKRYYWLKLHDDFFNEKYIKMLRKLPDGDKLVIVYLKMQLKALRSEGMLKYEKIMPSQAEEIALILDEDIHIVTLLIGVLKKMGVIEITDSDNILMVEMQKYIGSECDSARRVRTLRERNTIQYNTNKALQCNADVTNCNTEIEKELELEIEKRDKSKIATKNKYGVYKNVLLTADEYKKLDERFNGNAIEWINKLDEGIELKGYKYKSPYLAVIKWSKSEVKQSSYIRTQPSADEVDSYIKRRSEQK
jgi:predicted phage replisome organizer